MSDDKKDYYGEEAFSHLPADYGQSCTDNLRRERRVMSDAKTIWIYRRYGDIEGMGEYVSWKPEDFDRAREYIAKSDHDRIVAELRTKLDVEQFAHEYDVNQLNEIVESLTKKLSNSLAEVVELKEGNYAFSEQIAKQRYTIDELRAEVEALKLDKAQYEADCKRIEYFDDLHEKIATQARVREYLYTELNYYIMDCGRKQKEQDEVDAAIAVIEKEGAKDE